MSSKVHYLGVELEPNAIWLRLPDSPLVPAVLPELPSPNNLRLIDLSRTAVEDIGALAKARVLDDLRLCDTAVEDRQPPRRTPPARTSGPRWLARPRSPPTRSAAASQVPELRTHGGPRRLGRRRDRYVGLGRVRHSSEWTLRMGNIDIRNQPVSDLSPLAAARRLKTLRAAGSGVTDLSPLRRLQELVELDISNTGVSNLDPLAEVWNLRRLYLAHSSVTELGAARDLLLYRLDASWTRIDDFTDASMWRWLRVLRLAGTRITRMPDLRCVTRLRRLDIGHLGVDDLGIIEGLKLRSLEITHTPIEDLSPIRAALLEWLDVRWSHVRSLAPLTAHSRTLRHLALDIHQAPSLAELAAMQLTHLTIEGLGGNVIDARWVISLRHLQDLELIDCEIEDARPLLRLRNLQRLTVPVSTTQHLAALRAARPNLTVVTS